MPHENRLHREGGLKQGEAALISNHKFMRNFHSVVTAK